MFEYWFCAMARIARVSAALAGVEALETAEFGYVLETGEIVHSGAATDLMHDPRVTASYLGGH